MRELGDLLELIYGAGDRWRTARVTIREWQHPGRIRAAVERLQERQSGGGRMMTSSIDVGVAGAEPETVEHVVRTWIDGDRAREEREGPYAFTASAGGSTRRSTAPARTPPVNIAQTAATEAEPHAWPAWEEAEAALVAGPAEPHGLEPDARVERDGTRAALSSAELPRERLLALARSLEPAHPAR